jgi:hypothetical protein
VRLGPYEVIAPLGAGGMGEVYRARDSRLERSVAIKVLPGHAIASEEARQRFQREARAISQLSHPHVCTLFDVGREGDTDFLVMELVEGESLQARLARAALPVHASASLELGTERTLFTIEGRRAWASYDVARDSRFLAIVPDASLTEEPLVVVLGPLAEARAAAGR